MAKYKEIWQSPMDSTIIGYLNVETQEEIPIAPEHYLYQDFLKWQSAGGVADPAYTVNEINDYENDLKEYDAIAYLVETFPIVSSYNDAITLNRRPPLTKAKFKNLIKKRAIASRQIKKNFSEPPED